MNYGRFRKKKRDLEISSVGKVKKKAKRDRRDYRKVKNKAKRDAFTQRDRVEFWKNYQGRCFDFAMKGKCYFGDNCKFSHVTKDGKIVQTQRAFKETAAKTVKIWKGKEDTIQERKMDNLGRTYIGTVKKWRAKNEYGFISAEKEITFKGMTAKERIYVMKNDIICRSSEVGLNVGSKVRFQVYWTSKSLGASEVKNIDGTPIVFKGATAPNVWHDPATPTKKKPSTNKQKSLKKKEVQRTPKVLKLKSVGKKEERVNRTWKPLKYKPN